MNKWGREGTRLTNTVAYGNSFYEYQGTHLTNATKSLKFIKLWSEWNSFYEYQGTHLTNATKSLRFIMLWLGGNSFYEYLFPDSGGARGLILRIG